MLNTTVHRHQRGDSLIEVLVSMVILGLGLLGLAGMQVVSIKNNANANLRSQAAIYASEAIDRMRANLPNAINGDYNIALNDPVPTPAGTPTVAEDDLIRWLGALSANLPEGDGAIAINNATRVATVTISWLERERDPANAATGTRTLQFQLISRL